MVDIPPWLGHLRRDRRGLPVPYVNLWGTEEAAKLSIRMDPNVGMPAVFMEDSAATTPDFTRQNMQRQRRCMAHGLCQVCGRFVPWSRRYLVVAALSVEQIKHEGRDVAVVTEPWLCERCATFATATCPALIRRTRDEQLTLVPITSKRHVLMYTSRGWVEGPLEAESRRVLPAMWAKTALLNFKIQVVQP